MDPGGKIYTIDEFRCWKVENLDDQRSDENKNEGYYRVVSPQKVSRFAPLNRYYIIIDEVFFDNLLVIIYLLVVSRTYNIYVLGCIQEIIITTDMCHMSTTNLKLCRTKKFYKFKQVSNNLLYNDFIVNIYIQLDWKQVFTTY